MTQTIRLFLLFEAVCFIAASLIHTGLIVTGYEHPQARIAEAIIAAELTSGWMVSFIRPYWIRTIGLAAQGFALFGTLVGLFTIAIGIGPRTVPDLIFHAAIVVVLVWGLIVTTRTHEAVSK